jgi:hypothetical protein
MKKLFAILFLSCLPVFAADTIITATITVTNYPSTNGWQITLGGDSRTITNAFGATTIASNSSIGAIATNIYRHVVTNKFTSQRTASMPATNQVRIVFATGASASFSQTSNWLAFSYSTNTVSNSYTVRWPLSYEPVASTRSNIVDDLLTNIQNLATAKLAGTTVALTNFLSKTNHTQSVSGQITFTGSNTFHSVGSVWSNGYIIGATNIGGAISNNASNLFWTASIGTNYVTNLQGRGSAALSNLVVTGGFQTFANDTSQVQIGSNASAGGIGGIAIGGLATNLTNYGIAIGQNATATNSGDVAIGAGAVASGIESIALGYTARALHAGSVALGTDAVTTEPLQVRIGNDYGSISFASPAFINGNLVINNGARVSLSSGLTNALYVTNGATSGTDPTNGAWIVSVSGGWQYRGSATDGGSGGNRRLHNAGAETNGSGAAYSLTASTAAVDFGGTDPQITLPTAGTYLLTAQLTVSNATASDVIVAKLRDNDAAADVANSQVSAAVNGVAENQINITSIYTASGANRIDLYAHNATAARGSVVSTGTKIVYVRLY